MKAMDLTGLIKGLMVVIGIALALGRLDDLKMWATREAFGIHLARPETIVVVGEQRNPCQKISCSHPRAQTTAISNPE